MKLEQDFFNKLAKELDVKYFPNIKYFRDDENCANTHYSIELFSNGCLSYHVFINRLSKSCKETKKKIHEIVKAHVEDFGGYKYTFENRKEV